MEELNIKKIQVRNNAVITTADRIFTEEEMKELDNRIKLSHDKSTGILFKSTAEAKNLHNLIQKVVNVGPMVRDIKEGDVVYINPLMYLDRKLVEQRNSLTQDVADVTGTSVREEYNELDYNFPTIHLDGKEYLLLFDRDIEYIILDADGCKYFNK